LLEKKSEDLSFGDKDAWPY